MSALLAFATTTVAVAVLVVSPGTMFDAVAVAVSVMLVPEGVPEFTWSTTVKVTVFAPPVPRLVPSLQVMVPVPPTAGNVGQVQPAGITIDRNVVLGGVVSLYRKSTRLNSSHV